MVDPATQFFYLLKSRYLLKTMPFLISTKFNLACNQLAYPSVDSNYLKSRNILSSDSFLLLFLTNAKTAVKIPQCVL